MFREITKDMTSRRGEREALNKERSEKKRELLEIKNVIEIKKSQSWKMHMKTEQKDKSVER